MKKYKIIKQPGTSADVLENALNKADEEGYELKFLDSGFFVMIRKEAKKPEKPEKEINFAGKGK